MAVIIDGKKISGCVREEVRREIASLSQRGITTTLAVVIVGSDSASRVYVDNKKKACDEIGIRSLEYALPDTVTQSELNSLIERLNADKSVNGILVQLPLPVGLDSNQIIDLISPEKDVDAFCSVNVGKIMQGDYSFLPCTPAGIMELLKRSGIDAAGKNCVVVGRSNIVGKPMAMLLLHSNGTVTITHSKTRNLSEITRGAEILVVAVGRPKFVTADMVCKGAVVIDVGMNRDENGKLCGDVDFDAVKEKAGYITPVPGGVGPMTIAMLMKNTLTAVKTQNKIK